ncbi:MAG: TonB-dependent receptor [Bacteroidia bacterium]|nr:TonB-dependent receptor [Bacteroidia bacterium]
MKKENILLPLLALCFFQGNSQENDSTKHLNEVVITATRTAGDPLEVPRSITVITGEQINSSGAKNLQEVLVTAAGLSVIGTGQNFGSTSTVFTRGTAGNHTTIMIDGVRVSDPSSPANTFDLSEISLANIDRIEIVKGSNSTLYGSSAIGGVINIITRVPDSAGFHLSTAAFFGNYTGNSDWDKKHEQGWISDYSLNLSYKFKPGFYIGAGALRRLAHGFNSTVDTVVSTGTYKHPEQGDFYEKIGLNGFLGFKNEKWNVKLGGLHERQYTGIDDGPYKDDDNYSVYVPRTLFHLNATHYFNERHSVSVSAGHTSMKREATDDSSLVTPGSYDMTFMENNFHGKSYSSDLMYHGKFKGLSVLAGGGVAGESMGGNTYLYANSMWGLYEDSTDIDSLNLHTQTISLFTRLELEGSVFGEKMKDFRLAVGLRYADHSQFGDVFTWDLGPSYKYSRKGLLYFSWAGGFNAPSLYQSFTPEKDPFSGIQRGNEFLRPEYSQSFEVGIKQRVSGEISWSAALFRTQVRDVIDYVYLWDGSVVIDSLNFMHYKGDRYLNIGSTVATGMELSINAQLSPQLELSVSLTVLGGKFLPKQEQDTVHTKGHHVQIFSNGAFVTDGQEIYGLPRRHSSGTLALQWKPQKSLSIFSMAKYAGNRTDLVYDNTLGPYGAQTTTGLSDIFLLDMRVKYEINRRLNASVYAENILNEKYEEIRGYASRGRGWYLKLSASF